MLGATTRTRCSCRSRRPSRRCSSSSSARAQYSNYGQRVVAGQRLMQATSDIFLGWQHVAAGLDGQQRDFYVRQLRDWKGSVRRRGSMLPPGMAAYGRAVRLDARPRPRPLRRPDRDRRLPRQVRHLRPGDRDLRRDLRRPERTRLRGTPGRRRLRPGQGRDRPLTELGPSEIDVVEEARRLTSGYPAFASSRRRRRCYLRSPITPTRKPIQG